MNVNLIVLNYNGEKLIPECMPSIIEAKKVSSHNVRITVIDNESTDGSLDILRKFDSEIEIIKSKNKVLCSFNDVVGAQTEEIAILLNNDIRVEKNFIDPIVKVFEDKNDAFMIAFKVFDFNDEIMEGRSTGFIKKGWFGALARYKGWESDIEKFNYTFQAGNGAIRRDKFKELGGYSELYLPGRFEDSDLCFRAWKKGWKCYYQPESIVYHKGGESFKEKFGLKGISFIDSRNSMLFFWKNISSKRFWLSHILYLPIRIGWWLLRGEFDAIKGLSGAISRVPGVLKKRREEKKTSYKLKDREVFKIFE